MMALFMANRLRSFYAILQITRMWPFGALVSWFRSSLDIDIGLLANFGTETTLGFNDLLVSFDSEIRPERYIEMKRISESGH